jgi:hypothetical protein
MLRAELKVCKFMLQPKSTGSKDPMISLKIPSANYINKLEHTVISKN